MLLDTSCYTHQYLIVYSVNVNKEQDAIRLSNTGSCADCGRPMADKVADFALETQGQECLDKDQIIFAKIQCVHVCVCCFCTQKTLFIINI